MSKKKIGVLALQGAFEEHCKALIRLDAKPKEIRSLADWTDSLDGLILPGGESTVMGKLLHELSLFDVVKNAVEGGLPTLGTCAGLILLAKDIAGGNETHLACMDIKCKRNAYGRQLGSFSAVAPFGHLGEIPMVFIRAPFIEKASPKVEILAQVDGKIVAARQKNMLVTAFHPELTDDLSVHKYFLEEVK